MAAAIHTLPMQHLVKYNSLCVSQVSWYAARGLHRFLHSQRCHLPARLIVRHIRWRHPPGASSTRSIPTHDHFISPPRYLHMLLPCRSARLLALRLRQPRALRAARSMSTSHTYGPVSNPPDPPTSVPTSDHPDPTAPPSSTAIKLASRNPFTSTPFGPSDLLPSPMALFSHWFRQLLSPPPGQPVIHEPEAMAVSSVSSSGVPSTRIVALRTADDTGFVFFTNYNSRKSRELDGGYASMAMYWKEVSRQVRAVGRVRRCTREESEEYFRTRPRGSQLGAWASEQSSVVGEDEVQAKLEEVENRFEGKDVECPPFWGGWRLVPLWVGSRVR